MPIENTRRVYTDHRGTLTVTHLVVAAGLMALDHELLSVIHHENRPRFLFPRTAAADAQRIRRHIDELTAHRERVARRAARRSDTYPPTGANNVSADRHQQ